MFCGFIIPWDMKLCSLIEFMLQRKQMSSFSRNSEAEDSRTAWRCRENIPLHKLLAGAITQKKID
jgi:hypothetical protein